MRERFDLVVVGGCGHVGLPLAVAFASRGLRVAIYDIDAAAVDAVLDARPPFEEPGLPEALADVVREGQLVASTEPEIVSTAEHVVIVVGTPVDEHLNPGLFAVPDAIADLASHLRDEQLLVLRSTVFPGVTALVERTLRGLGLGLPVCFCPERIAEGKAMTELFSLPQLVAARDDVTYERAARLFGHLSAVVVRVDPEEAELAKLFTNSYRYIKFAIANQFFLIANEHGLDFERIRQAIVYEYPRAADLPAAGLAAGPCLFKDTMQLAAFNDNVFTLGHAAMTVNEGLPLYLVTQADRRFCLDDKTVGILGMAFKADSDDRRSSLSYKLKRILRFRASRVLCTDPFVRDDPTLVDLETVLVEADVIFVGAPHTAYRSLRIDRPVVDVWNLFGNGVTL